MRREKVGPNPGNRTITCLALLALAGAVVLISQSFQSPTRAGAPPGVPFQGKVEQKVLDDTANGETTHLMVLLAQQANLSAAYSMKNQDARGWYVYDTLTTFADKTQAGIKAVLASRGVSFRSFWAANAIAVTADRSVVDSLATRADVARIESDEPFHGITDPAPPANAFVPTAPDAVEWGVQNVNAPQVWAMGYTGQGIVIANQDTGMRWTHNAIKPHYRGWNGSTADHNYNWHDSIHSSSGNPCGNNSSQPCDDSGHGTHTTGTTSGDDGAGNQIGVAPGAKWIGCRNMDRGNGTPSTYTECFQFFIAPTDLNGQNPNPSLRPHVMNNSWGCPTSEGCAALTLETVVNNTQAAGIFVEASAGNSGPGCGSVSDPPANYGASFSTGALDTSNTLASFSSRGPGNTTNLLKPNISAPGVSVRSSYYTGDTSYSTLSGTSMAGPHVVGVVALLWSAHPEISRDITTTKQLLQNTANPNVTVNPAQTCGGTPSSQIPNNSFGYGRVDALAAVNALPFVTATPTNTPAPPTATPSPTSSPTATATLTPAPSPVLRVHVLLQGRPAPPSARWSEPLTLTLSPGGTSPTDYPAVTDSSGYFTVTITTGAGSYDWRVKNVHALAVAGSILLSPDFNSLEAGTLREGDANNDNCVSIADLALIRQSFGSASGDPNYNPNTDFNNDGVTNANDFTLFRNSFGMCGP